jgi:parallel beta-helix repeat protein
VVIHGNRIHGCGALPPTNHQHGIYAEATTGASITDNRIYDNADRGIQLYPDAQRATIARNVITGNGEGILFGGGADGASSGNVVEHNVIAASRVRWNVESSYGAGLPVGTGNVVRDNCLSASNGNPLYNPNGGVDGRQGYETSGNVVSTRCG